MYRTSITACFVELDAAVDIGILMQEGHFMLARPAQPTATEQAIGSAATPGSTTKGKKTKGRRVSQKLLRTDDFDLGLDLDSPNFSSSQQMRVPDDSAAEDPCKRSKSGRVAVKSGRPSPAVKPLRERLMLGARQTRDKHPVSTSPAAAGTAGRSINSVAFAHLETSKHQAFGNGASLSKSAADLPVGGFKTPKAKLGAPVVHTGGPAEVIDLASPPDELKPGSAPSNAGQRVSPQSGNSMQTPCTAPETRYNTRHTKYIPLFG
eukprot:scaffold90337_cov42-Prasinocladus_malaysianus.AAC.1